MHRFLPTLLIKHQPAYFPRRFLNWQMHLPQSWLPFQLVTMMLPLRISLSSQLILNRNLSKFRFKMFEDKDIVITTIKGVAMYFRARFLSRSGFGTCARGRGLARAQVPLRIWSWEWLAFLIDVAAGRHSGSALGWLRDMEEYVCEVQARMFHRRRHSNEGRRATRAN